MIMIAMFLAALGQTVLGTALPYIAIELGRMNLYSWVFTAYMMSSCIPMILVGTLSDMTWSEAVSSFGVRYLYSRDFIGWI